MVVAAAGERASRISVGARQAFANASANDRPKIGCIGVGGMGMRSTPANMPSFGDIVAVCDVDSRHAERAKNDPKSAKARPTPTATIARCSIATTSTW